MMNSPPEQNPIFSKELLQTIFNSLSAHIAILDMNGTILETNAAWKNFSRNNETGVKINFSRINYLEICDGATGEYLKDAQVVAQGIRKVMDGKTDEFRHDYPCHSPQGQRWFYMRAVLMDKNGPERVIVSHEDITQLKLVQEELTENQNRLDDKNNSLEEVNTALRVLLKQREQDKAEMEKKFLVNVKTLILPYIGKLKQESLNQRQMTLVNIVGDHLNDIISPMLQNFANAGVMLTPQEMQVASLVKDGKTTSEIADILFVAEATVSFHRKNLRDKLGIKNRRSNLRSVLMSM